MANGDIYKLGTLYMGQRKIPRPTRPWSNSKNTSFGPGDIVSYSPDAILEIRNTEVYDEYKMKWIEINEGGKKYLVSDRVMLVNICWEDLNSQNLIFGKTITIDGTSYKIRSLSGGSDSRNDNYNDGGTPTHNEWDRWIVNEARLHGLPTPVSSDLDPSLNLSDFESAHNKLWNWAGVYSIAQELWGGVNASFHSARGYDSTRRWYNLGKSSRFNFNGWRPVLEVLGNLPVISGKNEDLGMKKEPFSVSYNISNPNSNAITIKEIVNGSVLRTHDSSVHFSAGLNLNNEIWKNLPVNQKIEIKIEVTVSNKTQIVRTYTFTKIGSPPTAIPVEPKGDFNNPAIVDTINPVLIWRFEDTDPGDAQTAYQVFVEDVQGNVVHDSKKIASSQSFYIVPDLAWATRYRWLVRVWDRHSIVSADSVRQHFLPKRPPNVTDVEPGSSNVEEPAGTGTAPEFSWTFEDLDQQAQAAYQLRIYDTKDVLIYDSGRIEKTINMHKIPEGVLTEGTIYYAIVTVWDPFHLHKDSAEAYFVTNSTPTAPTLTSPANTYRTGLRPTFEGLIGHDKENDPQQFIIQISQDEKFEKHVLEISSMNERKGWQVSNGSQWYDLPEEGVDNSYEGKGVRYTLQVDLDEGRTYYWRLAAIDANTKARGKWSTVRCIRCGNMLQFKLKNPISTGNTAARRILIAADYYMANDGINKATMKIEVSNNALDANPVWEDATAAYQNADYFTFTNATKTAQQYALDIRVTFVANDSLGNIEMRGLGFSFD